MQPSLPIPFAEDVASGDCDEDGDASVDTDPDPVEDVDIVGLSSAPISEKRAVLVGLTDAEPQSEGVADAKDDADAESEEMKTRNDVQSYSITAFWVSDTRGETLTSADADGANDCVANADGDADALGERVPRPQASSSAPLPK